jgi:hypothetical protein
MKPFAHGSHGGISGGSSGGGSGKGGGERRWGDDAQKDRFGLDDEFEDDLDGIEAEARGLLGIN